MIAAAAIPEPTSWPRPYPSRESLIWLGVGVLLAVLGWVKVINLLSLIAYLALALQLINAFAAWRMVRKLRAVRLSPPPLFAGETTTVVGAVVNEGRGGAVVQLREASGLNARSWFFPELFRPKPVEFTGLQEFPVRGAHRLPAIEAISGYPFGLFKWKRTLDAGPEVTVLPALGSVNLEEFRRWVQRSSAPIETSRRAVRRADPTDGDVRGVRAYRPGDAPRDIHWKSSARRGQLLVREYDRYPPQDLLIVVDAFGTPSERFEWILSVAVSVAWAWVHGERPGMISLLIGGHSWSARSGPGTPAFVRNGFIPLARLTGDPNPPPIPSELLRGASRASRLLLTTRTNSPVAGQLRAAGFSLAVLDPNSHPGWYSPPSPIYGRGVGGEGVEK